MQNKFYIWGTVILVAFLAYWFVSQSSNPKAAVASGSDLPAIVDGKQVIKMTASGSGYSPNYFKVKAGVPVSWQITNDGSAGCAGTIVARSLFTGMLTLTPGTPVTQEFTASTPGTYRFSCAMGMYTGTFEVVN